MKTAFLNKKEIKEKYLKRVDVHYKADEIEKGHYWENGKGCAVGCTVEKSHDAHQAMEDELGIPKELAYLEDIIFENLPNEKAKEFPKRFLEAINVGADLSLITARFIVWQFEDNKEGLKNYKGIFNDNEEDKEILRYCEELVALYKRVIAKEKVSEDEFYNLYLKIDKSGAWARAGAWAWAWAWARARAWAGAGESKSYILMAEKLLELLKESK